MDPTVNKERYHSEKRHKIQKKAKPMSIIDCCKDAPYDWEIATAYDFGYEESKIIKYEGQEGVIVTLGDQYQTDVDMWRGPDCYFFPFLETKTFVEFYNNCNDCEKMWNFIEEKGIFVYGG